MTVLRGCEIFEGESISFQYKLSKCEQDEQIYLLILLLYKYIDLKIEGHRCCDITGTV